MTTVTDAIEAGRRAVAELYGHVNPRTGEIDATGADRVTAQHVLLDAWPILSAPLRELVDQWRRDAVTLREADLSYANCTLMDASVLEELIMQTDKELGCE